MISANAIATIPGKVRIANTAAATAIHSSKMPIHDPVHQGLVGIANEIPNQNQQIIESTILIDAANSLLQDANWRRSWA